MPDEFSAPTGHDWQVASSIPPLPAEDYACNHCGIAYASIDVAAALKGIRSVPDEVRTLALSIPEATLRKRPDEKTWSVLEYVCHVRDVYAVYTIRLHRARVEQSPVLEPMLNDLRAARFRYNRRDLAPVLAELADNAAGLADEAARFSEKEWDRVATRLPGEERSARWMIRQAMHEGKHHLHDISAVSRRLETSAH
jgi:hypothetical protein